jgi:surface carbohydrate biosynthesis protein
MRRKHILFFVDHKWRDLLSSVYIKLLLEKRGYRVTIARNGFERFILPVLQPDAVIFNHVYEDKRVDLVRRYSANGLQVIVLPTENIPVLDKVKQLFAGQMSDLSIVDLYFVWNEEVGDIMRKGKAIDESLVKVIGVPRYDIYREPLSSLIVGKKDFLAKYNLNPDYPVITMTTNFTLAGFASKNIEFFKKDIKGLKSDQIGYDHDLALRDLKSREIFHDAFYKLVKDYPEVNFIIKPHPSEDHTPYYDIINKLNSGPSQGRVAVVLTEYIWDVLSATDILLERSCLTGMEAWFMGKPTIELHLNPDEWYHSVPMAGGSDEVSDYAQLRERIDHYLAGGKIDSNKLSHREEIIKLWCGNLDGGACQRVVDETDKFLRDKPPALKSFSWSDIKTYMLYYSFIYPDYRLLDLKLYKNRGRKIDKLGRTDKYFRAKDILNWEVRIRPLL